jgi:predicted DNA-binding protein YlxM (UPF0122 family)
MPMNKKVIVLIGDLVSSRKINERIIFDKKLTDKLSDLNKSNSNILSPYTLTIGDEIQAVFEKADKIFNDAIAILTAIIPERMRFSIGIGKLIKPINPKQAIGMDGPAFYYARDGIDQIKKTGYLFNINGDEIPGVELLQQNLFLISEIMNKWNSTKLRIFLKVMNNIPVKEIAQDLDISVQAVYKAIRSGSHEIIADIFKKIEIQLNLNIKG